jgi:hypothetical protein
MVAVDWLIFPNESMKFPLFAISLVLTSFATSHGAVVLIANSSFESPALTDGNFTYSNSGEVPGWSTTATGAPDRGVWFTGATGKDGNQIAFVYPNNGFAQQTSQLIEPDTTYSMTYLAGRPGAAGVGLTAQLWAGGTVASGSITGGTLLASNLTIAAGPATMTEYTFSYNSPAVGSVLGQPLSVRFANAGTTYVSFDHIRVNTSPIPEPSTGAILGLATLGLITHRRQRTGRP